MKVLLKNFRLWARGWPNRNLIVGVIPALTQAWSSWAASEPMAPRERISLNTDWRFWKFDGSDDATGLIYDVRPAPRRRRRARGATDGTPREAVDEAARPRVLKPWILPAGNAFLKDPAKRHTRPEGNPGSTVPYVQAEFDDRSWERVNLPHDWAIKGPFHAGWSDRGVGGGMGRLPSPGIGWYRKKFSLSTARAGKSMFLDVDGAMSYAVVWLNGTLVGGWPYGYASWRVDLTPYIVPGEENLLAIRLDNPPNSSRWYPGGGIYRNVWLVTTHPVHVGQWGTFVTRTPPVYSAFHERFPDKVILSSENAAALSTRGEYLFPVSGGISAPVKDGRGGDPQRHHVSAYELYTADFGSSADKVFASLDRHPYVAGGFVWSGWDYLGEPTPYYSSRSSYFGVVDLAGFKKDRFYLYQFHWRSDLPMAHILPHWTWPDRVGKITPVHVFTSGDEAELFPGGRSLGRKVKRRYEYRLRWGTVVYEPGELKVVAYKNGKRWAQAVVRSASAPAKLLTQADRDTIAADGRDLSFVTVTVADKNGWPVPRSHSRIRFSIEGPGELVATDNGDPTSFEPFGSCERNAFGGLCLAIVRANRGQGGVITVKAESEGLVDSTAMVRSRVE